MNEMEQEGYELFRRAIIDRDDLAWAEIHTRYRALLISWAYRSSARTQAGEWCDDIADQALARAWAALTPERFSEFSTLSRLLSYLRSCVITTAIDCARAQTSLQRTLPMYLSISSTTPEQIVIDSMDRDELWQTALRLTSNSAERIVLVESFALNLPPRTIHARHPQLFNDVSDVYSAKRNLFARLHRNRDLLRLHNEYAVA